jgi:hypothetical protein
MALIDHDAGLIVTAAPGTGSTSLIAAFTTGRRATPVPVGDAGPTGGGGVDPKHATVGQLVEAGLLASEHGLRIVTTTRNPFDFYVAEWERTRSRWVLELRDPGSWVHTQPGAIDRIVDAVTLDFEAWLRKSLGVVGGGRPAGRRINRGHVDEADVVLRMESVEPDLRRLLGLELEVPRDNVTDRDRAYWRHYSPAARQLVALAHAADLERFGYAF